MAISITKSKAAYPTLEAAKIQKPELLKRLHTILTEWEMAARAKDTKAQSSKKLTSSKKILSDAFLSTISDLKKTINKGTFDVYVAYDNNHKVQAVAAKHFARLYGKKRGRAL